MNRKPRYLAISGLVAAAVAVAWWLLRSPSEGADAAQTATSRSFGAPSPGEHPQPAALAPGAESTSSAVTPSAAPGPYDRAARDRRRESIWHAFAQAPPANETVQPGAPYVLPSAVPDPPGVPGRLEPEYIRDRMHKDFFPMAGDCYDQAQKRSPGLAGKVVLRFAIVGDANTGGIVESADVLDRSTIRDQGMIECMRESMLSMTFPPPKQGGFVTVEYPIDFSPDEPDGG